ncbi:MAG: HAMP domain-containing protein [Planctomycetes bacterium]|nr:HAMP domain-containing protein [Planctomycetota bacterium]
MKRTLRFHLLLAFALVIASFGVASAFVFRCIGRIDDAIETIKRREEAVRYGLDLASCARDQYIHEAHLIITRDAEHVAHVREAVERVQRCQQRVRAVATTRQESEYVAEIDATAGEFRRVFFDEIVPAMRDGRHRQALELHEESEQQVERIIVLIDRLGAGFRAQIEEAHASARTLGRQAFHVTLTALALSLVLTAAVGFLLGRSILTPIRELIAGTQAVARGDLSPALPSPKIHELAALADSFGRMTRELRDHQQQLLAAEKQASLGTLAAGVAHQLNNPLGVLLGYIKLLRQGRIREAAQVQDAFRILEDEATEAKLIVETLLSLARPGTLCLEEVDAGSLLGETVEHAQRYKEGSPARIVLQPPDTAVTLKTDRKKLQQALTNLIVNGLEAMPEGGTVRIRCRRLVGSNGGGPEQVAFEVEDEGPGIPPQDLPRVFDPYFTTKKSGTGLGLTITHEVVRALGGAIEVRNTAPRGCAFLVTLPAEKSPSP